MKIDYIRKNHKKKHCNLVFIIIHNHYIVKQLSFSKISQTLHVSSSGCGSSSSTKKKNTVSKLNQKNFSTNITYVRE